MIIFKKFLKNIKKRDQDIIKLNKLQLKIRKMKKKDKKINQMNQNFPENRKN